MNWGRGITELQGSSRRISDQNPFIYRPLMVTFILLQVQSSAHWPCLSHLLSPLFQKLHPYSFIPHPRSIPGPPSTPHPPSPSSLITITPHPWLCYPIHPKAGHFTLPFPISFPRSEAFHLFPSSFMHHLSVLVFTPSDCTYVFLQFPACHHRVLLFCWDPL